MRGMWRTNAQFQSYSIYDYGYGIAPARTTRCHATAHAASVASVASAELKPVDQSSPSPSRPSRHTCAPSRVPRAVSRPPSSVIISQVLFLTRPILTVAPSHPSRSLKYTLVRPTLLSHFDMKGPIAAPLLAAFASIGLVAAVVDPSTIPRKTTNPIVPGAYIVELDRSAAAPSGKRSPNVPPFLPSAGLLLLTLALAPC